MLVVEGGASESSACKRSGVGGPPEQILHTERHVEGALAWCSEQVTRLKEERGSNAIVLEARGTT
jgi:hypothetical protein